MALQSVRRGIDVVMHMPELALHEAPDHGWPQRGFEAHKAWCAGGLSSSSARCVDDRSSTHPVHIALLVQRRERGHDTGGVEARHIVGELPLCI